MIMTFVGNIVYVSSLASFALSLVSGGNDATRATNKLYAHQKSRYCPIEVMWEDVEGYRGEGTNVTD